MNTPKCRIIQGERVPAQDTCRLCKDNKCIIDHCENNVYSGRITRSITKWLDYINNFVVVEAYRSMPLLGDEWDIPNWEVHIARYSIVFVADRK